MDGFTDWVKGRGRLGRRILRWATLPYRVLRRDRRPGLVVLLYHRVGGGSRSEIDMPVSVFERQIRYLRRQYRIVSLNDVQIGARWAAGGTHQDVIAITFDDGCAETYDFVYPILRWYGISATVYVPAMYLEEQRPFDFGAYRHMDSTRRPRPLSWHQVAEMVRSNVFTIGAHTYTHADLSRMSVDKAKSELEDCDRLIESRLGFRPRHFAYPWGRWAPAIQPLVVSRYETVTLGGPGKNPFIALDPSRLWRYPVNQSDGFWLFRARLHTLVGRDTGSVREINRGKAMRKERGVLPR